MDRIRERLKTEGGLAITDDDVEFIGGSGNVYRDRGRPIAALEQARAVMAAKRFTVPDERGHCLCEAERPTGISHANLFRSRNTELRRFTLDRMITTLGKLDVDVTFRPRTSREAVAQLPAAWGKARLRRSSRPSRSAPPAAVGRSAA